MWGFRICRETGLGLATIYPQLELLEAAGHVRGYREASPSAGQPRRRLYELTGTGHELAAETRAALAHRSSASGGDHRSCWDRVAGFVRG
jgi:DNA-binding PadR family transcriptional regulator